MFNKPLPQLLNANYSCPRLLHTTTVRPTTSSVRLSATISITYGFARISKTDDEVKNLATQHLQLSKCGTR